MITRKIGNRSIIGLALALLVANTAWAQTQVTASDFRAAATGEVTITLTTTGAEPEVSVFATDSPARIVLDMADTTSSVDSAPVSVGAGDVQSFSTLSAGGRTRVLVDLARPSEFEYSTQPGAVVLTIGGAQAATAVSDEAARSLTRYSVENVDFRRGEDGQSRVIVTLDGEGASVAANASAGKLIVEVFNASLPDALNQVLDVVDFATPVQIIDVAQRNDNVRLEMMVSGVFEHMAYQTGDDVVIEVSEVAPVIEPETESISMFEDRTYSGERVTFNFQ
ncbi:MAG: AMIN domain-containing protein, partial [Gammaproteobacteria bacterium]